MSTVRKAGFVVPAGQRAQWETLLEERLSEDGFIVASCEVSRDGPWRIEIFGEGDAAAVEAGDPGRRRGAGPRPAGLAMGGAARHRLGGGEPAVLPALRRRPLLGSSSHDGAGLPAGLLPLRIDAGLAFGTGTHATTRGCLEMLATLDPRETANAVDVGCGSGILAIAMAKLWQRPVTGRRQRPRGGDGGPARMPG